MKTTSLKLLSILGMGTILGSGLGSGAMADQQILDDLIVVGSICAGQDCVNGESFGFDTIRLKENNLRIKFDDTSTSASFPNNDWQLTANDTSNGGANRFSIDDISGGRTPFTIEASAPSHSLYVDDGGRIGFGTSTPVVEMHLVDGDSPTLRLEQNGSSGFTPQIWDVAGNEAGFFVRDATNGSKLSFRIRPSAPQSSIDIAANGDVGIGTASPGAQLHVRTTDGSSKVFVEEASSTNAARTLLALSNNGVTILNMTDTSNNFAWNIQNRGNTNLNEFRITNASGAGEELRLTETGDLIITGQLTTSGTTCGGGGCDAVFDPGTEILPISDHANLMYSNRYLPSVGPTAENQPFNITHKVGGMLNELEHAHIYINELNERLAQVEAELAALKQ